jgi:predicted dehydrogenase
VPDPLTIVLVGIGGYGEVYLSALLDSPARADVRFLAAVDPESHRSPRARQLHQLGVPVYESLERFYANDVADLAVLSTPIHFHCPQTCLALRHGSAVLCEKPAAATVQEVDRMLEAEHRSRRFVAVGFQWSFSPPIQRLKRDIGAGVFGRPRRARALTLWPRPRTYYTRNAWAGRLRDDAGNWILDSPANNAMAHDLHNLLFLLGDEPPGSAHPIELLAETYRANAIETYDTVATRVRTDTDVDIVFLASHAVRETSDPAFLLEFDDATLSFRGGASPIVARCHDGSMRSYASPNSVPQMMKLWSCVDAQYRGTPPACGLRAARAHTLCINGIHRSVRAPAVFPADHLHEDEVDGEPSIVMRDLPGIMRDCYDHHALPHERGIPWAQPGRLVDLREFRFPSNRPQNRSSSAAP